MADNWTIWNPEFTGETLGIINSKGKVISGNNALQWITSQVKRGVAKDKTNNLKCSPLGSTQNKDIVTLKKLLGVNAHEGNKANLSTISETNRYKGKVDWSSDRVTTLITQLHNRGSSIRDIAAKLVVSPQALTAANKKFHLYPSRPSPIAIQK